MNRYLHRSTGSNAYATFFYGQIDERARQLRYVNAGHNPPCLLRCAAISPSKSCPRAVRSSASFRRAATKKAPSICGRATC